MDDGENQKAPEGVNHSRRRKNAPPASNAKGQEKSTRLKDRHPEGFVAVPRNGSAIALMKRSRNAFVLLFWIAMSARRTNAQNSWKLRPGEARIEGCGDLGMTQGEYRNAKEVLASNKLATFKGTNKATIATLASIDVFDINAEVSNEQCNDQSSKPATNKRRSKYEQTANRTQKTQAGIEETEPKNVPRSKEGGTDSLTRELDAGRTTASGKFRLPDGNALPSPLYHAPAEAMLKDIAVIVADIKAKALRVQQFYTSTETGEKHPSGEQWEPEARLALDAWAQRAKDVRQARVG